MRRRQACAACAGLAACMVEGANPRHCEITPSPVLRTVPLRRCAGEDERANAPVRITRRSLLAGRAIAALTGSKLRAAEPTPLTFEQLYKSISVRGLQFSDIVLALKGKPVVIRGYMAPPLKAESKFFVLTREPMAICPFCQSDADWPSDIVVVYLDHATPLVSGGEPVVVRGRLEVGSAIDADTGFVSQIRVVDAVFRRA